MSCYISSGNGSHPLLTVNGTPATTPSSETHRTLGHQNSDTPVSTPTESHVLLNQQLQDSTNMGPHYQEILRHYQSPPATLVGSGAAMPPRDLYIPRPPMVCVCCTYNESLRFQLFLHIAVEITSLSIVNLALALALAHSNSTIDNEIICCMEKELRFLVI